jgi:thiazole tautomerase (transcriptional regulator TenI)
VTPLPRLHLVTDDATALASGFAGRAAGALAAGGAAVALHLRAPSAGGRVLHELATGLRDTCDRTGSMMVVNDRVDVALAAGADGVQLGARGLPVVAVRQWVEDRLVVGASVHTRGEAMEAVAAGADFLLVGTVYETASHPGRSGRGIEAVRELEDAGVAVIGIGGITPERARAVLKAGAHGVAVMRGVWAEDDPAAAVTRYLDAMNERGT